MNTFSIKIIFLVFTFYIFLHSCSYASFEIREKKNIGGGVLFLVISVFSVISSNIMFFIS